MKPRASNELPSDRRSNSGVYPTASPGLVARLGQDLRAASARVRGFRASADDEPLGHFAANALHEIDLAHEQLRVAEEELHAQADEILAMRARLDRERRLYGELFDAAPEAYLVTDDRGMVLEANRRAALLIQLDPALLVGKPLVALVAHDDRSAFYNVLEAASDAVFHCELRIVPRNASEALWVSLSAQRGVRDASTTCIRWLIRSIEHEKEEQARQCAEAERLRERIRCLGLEADAIRQLAENERDKRERAEQHEKLMSQALAEAAHELRSPLSSIAGWIKMIDEGLLEEPTSARALQSMTRSVGSMVRIVENLIDHARAENHQLALKMVRLNVVRLLIELMEDLKPLAELKKIRFIFSAESHLLELQGDPWRLRQLFRNILGNAIKFTPENGSVQIATSTTAQHAQIVIRDSGRGIPADALDRIFTPFAQVGAPGTRHTGLGLGLSIAQRLAELHGGAIRAESKGVGQGSTFTVQLSLSAPN